MANKEWMLYTSISQDNLCYVLGLIILDVLGDFVLTHTSVSLPVTLYTIHWVMVNPDTADEIYEHVSKCNSEQETCIVQYCMCCS
jgi:hypothetical protein